MLLRRNKFKLRQNKDFFNQARRKESYFFRLYYLFDHHLETIKLTVIVPKKKLKQAVLRNKSKRWLKEIFAQWLKLQKQPLPVYLVIYLKQDFSTKQKKQVKNELVQLLGRFLINNNQ